MKENLIVVYYPFWVQVITWIGVPALTGVALWLMSRPLWEDIGTSQFLAGLMLGAALLYQCAISWRALRYLRVRMIASDDGLEVLSGVNRRKFSWDELGAVEEYPFATTARFQLRSGKTLIWAFDNMKNLDQLKELFLRPRSSGSP